MLSRFFMINFYNISNMISFILKFSFCLPSKITLSVLCFVKPPIRCMVLDTSNLEEENKNGIRHFIFVVSFFIFVVIGFVAAH